MIDGEPKDSTLDYRLAHLPSQAEAFLSQESVRDEDFRILNSPELRTEYVHLMDRLIATMDLEKTEVAVFLDKSARPLAWLMKELWPVIGPKSDDGSLRAMPDIKFINIDREQWGPIVGRSEAVDGLGINVDLVPIGKIDELRSVFAKKELSPETAHQADTLFDGKNVMVIDEVRVSGDTLAIAKGVLGRAFPDAKTISGFHWMGGNAKYNPKSGGRRITELPVWYNRNDSTGRGISDVDIAASMNSSSARQRKGASWLSTRFTDVDEDEKGSQLRKECELVAQELALHKIPYIPGSAWDTDKMIDRIEQFNGLTAEEYKRLRNQADSERVSFVQIYRQFIQSRDSR